jgi:hypothetical protein
VAPKLGDIDAESVRSARGHAEHAVSVMPGTDSTPASVPHVWQCGDAVIAVSTASVATVPAGSSGEHGAPAYVGGIDAGCGPSNG